MDGSEFSTIIPQSLRPYLLPIVIGIIGLIFLSYGLIQFFGQNEQEEIVFEKSFNEVYSEQSRTAQDKVTSSSSDPTAENTKNLPAGRQDKNQIIIDVEGAVLKPGVYSISKDGRMKDALIAAGGLSADADNEKIARVVNLAARVRDGEKIYFPKKNDTTILGVQTTTETADGSISINTASLALLDSLPGVGKVTAQKIIDARPYSTVEELQQKKIVTQKVFDQIKEQITAQ